MMTAADEGFCKLAVEHWRLVRVVSRLVERLPPEAQARVAAQARFASNRLEALANDQGVALVTFEGRTFEPSLPVTAVNADDFTGAEGLLVSETVEPTVMANGRVVHLGKVVIALGGSDASRN